MLINLPTLVFTLLSPLLIFAVIVSVYLFYSEVFTNKLN